MARNLIQDGTRMSYQNSSGSKIDSGQVVAVGNQLGVAVADIADGAAGELAMAGIYECPKVSAGVIAQGEKVLWVAASSAFNAGGTTPASGDISGACVAWEAVGAGITTVKVSLNLGVGTVT